MPVSQSRIYDEAAEKATGKTWNEWIKLLDKAGADTMSHKDIARMLQEKKLTRQKGPSTS